MINKESFLWVKFCKISVLILFNKETIDDIP